MGDEIQDILNFAEEGGHRPVVAIRAGLMLVAKIASELNNIAFELAVIRENMQAGR